MRIYYQIILLLCSSITACSDSHESEYTLYRTGWNVEANKADEALRINIARFGSTPNAAMKLDQAEEDAYNRANCEIAAELFTANQPNGLGIPSGSIKAKYWCEKGEYRP